MRAIIWSVGARCSQSWSVMGPMLSVTAWSWMVMLPMPVYCVPSRAATGDPGPSRCAPGHGSASGHASRWCSARSNFSYSGCPFLRFGHVGRVTFVDPARDVEQHAVVVVHRHPGARDGAAGEACVGRLRPEQEHEVGDAPGHLAVVVRAGIPYIVPQSVLRTSYSGARLMTVGRIGWSSSRSSGLSIPRAGNPRERCRCRLQRLQWLHSRCRHQISLPGIRLASMLGKGGGRFLLPAHVHPHQAVAFGRAIGLGMHLSLNSWRAGTLGMSTQFPRTSNFQPW